MFRHHQRKFGAHRVDDPYKFCLRACERRAVELGYDAIPGDLNLDKLTTHLVEQIIKLNAGGLLSLLQLPDA